MRKPIEIDPSWDAWKIEIVEQLNKRGMSMKEASLKAHLGETWVRDAIKRNGNPTASNLTRIKEAIGLKDKLGYSGGGIQTLKVAGRAQAGAFLDVSLIDEDTDPVTINVASVPSYSHAHQYALEVVGDSMNKVFDDGSFVTCAAWGDLGLPLTAGMCLHVERHQGHLVEVTLKKLAIMDRKMILMPVFLDGDDSTEIVVKGLVIGMWKPIRY